MIRVKSARNAGLSGRGYSLVEIAIVLVAIGTVVSAASWAFINFARIKQEESERKNMQALRAAVVSYAATTRTPGTAVEYISDRDNTIIGSQYIPSNRPILPCPDMDDDGFEDRNAPLSGALRITVARSPVIFLGQPPVLKLGDTPGLCVDDKGWLPWRTLGIKPADVWGRRYTYWVDGRFTMVPFGFDASTRANKLFKHAVEAVIGSVIFPTRKLLCGLGGTMIPDESLSPVFFRYVTTHQPGLDSTVISSGDRQHYPLPGIVASYIPGLDLDSRSRFQLVAGELVSTLTQARRGHIEQRRVGPDGRSIDVLENCSLAEQTSNSIVVSNGPAFVIVSHGANGFGGLNHSAVSSQNPCIAFTSAEVLSNAPAEAFNARMNKPCNSAASGNFSGARSTANSCPASSLLPCRQEITASSAQLDKIELFVVRKDNRAHDTLGSFDDLVVWMMPGELIAELDHLGLVPRQAPPVAVLRSKL